MTSSTTIRITHYIIIYQSYCAKWLTRSSAFKTDSCPSSLTSTVWHATLECLSHSRYKFFFTWLHLLWKQEFSASIIHLLLLSPQLFHVFFALCLSNMFLLLVLVVSFHMLYVGGKLSWKNTQYFLIFILWKVLKFL